MHYSSARVLPLWLLHTNNTNNHLPTRRWAKITGYSQGELLPPYHLFLTLQMQPSQAHAPSSWFFLDKATTRVRYYELEDGPHDLGYGFAAELEERLPMQPPVVLLHEAADLRGPIC